MLDYVTIALEGSDKTIQMTAECDEFFTYADCSNAIAHYWSAEMAQVRPDISLANWICDNFLVGIDPADMAELRSNTCHGCAARVIMEQFAPSM